MLCSCLSGQKYLSLPILEPLSLSFGLRGLAVSTVHTLHDDGRYDLNYDDDGRYDLNCDDDDGFGQC